MFKVSFLDWIYFILALFAIFLFCIFVITIFNESITESLLSSSFFNLLFSLCSIIPNDKVIIVMIVSMILSIVCGVLSFFIMKLTS